MAFKKEKKGREEDWGYYSEIGTSKMLLKFSVLLIHQRETTASPKSQHFCLPLPIEQFFFSAGGNYEVKFLLMT